MKHPTMKCTRWQSQWRSRLICVLGGDVVLRSFRAGADRRDTCRRSEAAGAASSLPAAHKASF